MVRNLIIVFMSVLLIGGVVWADQPQTSAAGDADLAKAIQYDENWAVRNGELTKFDASRHAWTSPKAAKALQIDTLLHFTAESGGVASWADMIQTTEWDTVDNTLDLVAGYWHRDTFNAISGSYSLWWGDPAVGPNGGYLSERIEYIDVPAIAIDAGDAPFLIYKQYVRCEEAHGFGIFEGWDGYNVRVDTTDDETNYFEVAPYKVAADSSYYTHPPDPSNEWNILRAWERWGQQFGPYVAPYDQWIGGYACDGTGQGGTETIVSKIYDLRPFAGQTVNISFAGATDWGYDTLDDSTLFGYIIDDVLIVDGLDSAALANLPDPLGGDTLFFEDFEAADPGWNTRVPGVPTGNWWWLASGGHTGIYKAFCSDPFSGEYPENCDNAIRSPKLASDQFNANMAELDLHWYLTAYTADDHSSAYNQYRVYDGGEWDQWRQISVLTHPTATSYVYSLGGVTTGDWWNTDQWSDFMHNMTPLVTDTTMTWDSLQVQIGFSSDAGWDTTGYTGLSVDDVTLSGRIGAPYDIGVSALKVPSPNANDVEVVVDSVAITNYGFNVASSGVYQVYMAVLDTNRTAVFGPTQVLDFLNAPNVEPLETVMAPLDPTVAKFTLTEEMAYDIKAWTFWASDTSDYNDTLKIEEHSTDTKQTAIYPSFYNYPAGQGQLRYNDQGLYYYPYINIRSMGDGDIAAVHFEPDADFMPFWIRLGLFQMADSNHTCTFHVWGSGNTPAEAPLLTSVTINSDSSRVVLSDSTALEHLSSDFWMGVEFATGCGSIMGTETGENDPEEYPGRNWGHSYLYTDTTGWEPYDYDWLLDAVISWRTVDPEALPSLSGPPKNSSGNLYLDWADVSQSQDYLIYRSTHIESTFPFLDSTAVSNYTDVGVVGNTGTHYYYLFNSRHQDGGVYDKTSKAIGEFDRSLLNAK